MSDKDFDGWSSNRIVWIVNLSRGRTDITAFDHHTGHFDQFIGNDHLIIIYWILRICEWKNDLYGQTIRKRVTGGVSHHLLLSLGATCVPPVRVCWPRRNQTRQLMGIVHLPLPPQDSGTRCHLILGTHSLLVSLSLYWKHISLNVRISCICNLLGYWHSLFYIFSNYCKRIEACEMRTKNCYYYYISIILTSLVNILYDS